MEQPQTRPSSEDNEGLYALAHGFLSNGRLQEAEDLMMLLLTLEPASARYWCGLGAVTYARGNHKAAAVAFGVARGLDPEDTLAGLNLGQAWLELEEPELARRALDPVARKSSPEAARARVLLRRCKEVVHEHG